MAFSQYVSELYESERKGSKNSKKSSRGSNEKVKNQLKSWWIYFYAIYFLTVIIPLPIYQLPTRWKPVQRVPVNCWVELDWSGLMQIFLSLSKPPNLFIIVRCGTPADGLYRLNPTFLFGLYIQLGLKKILGAKINFRVIMKIHFALKLRQILWPSQNIWALTIIVIFGWLWRYILP